MPKKASQIRACDGCYLRKVKCSGCAPCESCIEAGLRCTTERPFGRRGPKTRIFTPQSQGCFVVVDDEILPIDVSAFEQAGDAVLSMQNGLQKIWERNAHLQSIVDLETIQHTALHCEHDTSSQCVIIAIALYLAAEDVRALQIPMKHCGPQCDHQWQTHLQRCMTNLRQSRLNLDLDLIAHRSREWVIILFLISRLFEKLDNRALSWYYLQDAATVLHIDLDYEDKIASNIGIHLAVTERFRAVRECKSICTNSNFDATDAARDMFAMYALLRPFDNSFLVIWNNPASIPPIDYILRLRDHVSFATFGPAPTRCLTLLQFWLLHVVWRLSLRLDNVLTGLVLNIDTIVTNLVRMCVGPFLTETHEKSWMIDMLSDIHRRYIESLDMDDLLEYQQYNIDALDRVIAGLSS